MREKKEILEFADKTVERAIEAACRHFNVEKEQLEIKLITRGSTGLFGLGGRRAKITACLKDDAAEAMPQEEPVNVDEEHSHVDTTSTTTFSDYSPFGDDDASDAGEKSNGFDASAYAPGDEESDSEMLVAPEGDYSPDASDEIEESHAEELPDRESAKIGSEETPEPETREEEQEEELSEEMLERLEKARVLTTQILDKAGLDAIVEIRADVKEPQLNISGEDISLIIGKDGHTLDSLEYIVNLNLKRAEEKGGKRILIDAQGYRAKREEGLRRTAEKLAYKAKKTRRAVAMAPMNSKERRVVHMAVKAINGVKTHSTGDGRLRKVIITPVKKGDGGKRHHSRRYNRK